MKDERRKKKERKKKKEKKAWAEGWTIEMTRPVGK